MFRQKLGEVELGRRGVQEEWEEGRVKLAVKGTEREREGRGEERNGWWDKECKRKKKLRKKLREWRREGKSRNTGEEEGNIGNYVRERKEENG